MPQVAVTLGLLPEWSRKYCVAIEAGMLVYYTCGDKNAAIVTVPAWLVYNEIFG